MRVSKSLIGSLPKQNVDNINWKLRLEGPQTDESVAPPPPLPAHTSFSLNWVYHFSGDKGQRRHLAVYCPVHCFFFLLWTVLLVSEDWGIKKRRKEEN